MYSHNIICICVKRLEIYSYLRTVTVNCLVRQRYVALS